MGFPEAKKNQKNSQPSCYAQSQVSASQTGCPYYLTSLTLILLFEYSLGFIIPRGQCVSGHVDRSSRIRNQNALTEKTWEEALQGKGIL